MARLVIACYRPKVGKERELDLLMKTHVSRLRAEGLVTDREPILMKSRDGTVIEVFEWLSEEAIQGAHENEAVRQMWQEYEAVCKYVPLADVPEASELFSGFDPVDRS